MPCILSRDQVRILTFNPLDEGKYVRKTGISEVSPKENSFNFPWNIEQDC